MAKYAAKERIARFCSFMSFRSAKRLWAGVWLGVLLLVAFNAHADWQLVWSDEFNGTSLNTNTWYSDNGQASCIDGNGDLELYTNNAATFQVTNGYLRIIANVVTNGGTNYLTSGRLETEGINDCTQIIYTNQALFTMTYGAIEWRARLPQGPGAWPALWLAAYGSTNPATPQYPYYGWWPNCGEMDVVENNGMEDDLNAESLHYYNGNYEFSQAVADVTQWHVYRLEWYTNQFDWYVDGVLGGSTSSWNPPPGYSYPAPFDAKSGGFIIVMDLALGGPYTGSPSQAQIAAALPYEMDVDYVRVYQQVNPLLSEIETNGGLVVSWPLPSGTWVLEQTMSPTGPWTQVPVSLYQTNQSQISFSVLPPLTKTMFYKLLQQ